MERRESYRVPIDPERDGLHVRLQLNTRTAALEGEIVDLTRKGAGVRVSARMAPETPPPGPVLLYFTDADAGELPAIQASVRSVIFTPGFCRYGLRFDPSVDLSQRLPPHLLARFNQRVARRIRPPHPIRVELRGKESEALFGVLRDLSWSGLSVNVPADALVAGPSRQDLVELRFALPSQKKPVLMVGEVLRDLLIDDELCYGIRFDARRTKDFTLQQTYLKRYIARCHIEKRQREAP